MIRLLAVVLLAVPAPAKPVDVGWVLDAELLLRATAAEREAGDLAAKASAAEAKHAELAGTRKSEAAEISRIEATLPSLSGSTKRLSESHLSDLKERISEDDRKLADLDQEAKGERAKESADRQFAAAARAEDARRKKGAASAFGADQDLGPIPDARLLAGKAYYRDELSRVPAQLAALDAATVREESQAGRMEVIARTEAVRASAASMQQMVTRIDDELSYRKDSKADEAQQARDLSDAARAKAADQLPEESASATSAHSAAIDRVLNNIIAQQDEDARLAKERSDMRRVEMRISIFALVLLVGIGGVWYLLSRRS